MLFQLIEEFCPQMIKKKVKQKKKEAKEKKKWKKLKNKAPKRKLSLKALGYLIDLKLISDARGHIYRWDPRYKKRDVEKACRAQEALNAKFGNASENKNSKNLITLRGNKFFFSFCLD